MFYKVLRVYEDCFYSAVVSGDYAINYEVGQWTKIYNPKTGGIFVFDTLENASAFLALERFLGLGYDYVIYACEVKNAIPIPYRTFATNMDIEDFWSLYHTTGEFPRMFQTPEGTYVAESIKLVERVTKYDN